MLGAVATSRCVQQFLELDDIIRQGLVNQTWQAACCTRVVHKAGVRTSGIPSRLRIRFWLEQSRRFVGAHNHDGSIQKFMHCVKKRSGSKTSSNGLSEGFEAEILIDVPRTYPSHPLFAATSFGQNMLTEILYAVALNHPLVGYCQGMNFVAASLFILAHESDLPICFIEMGTSRTSKQNAEAQDTKYADALSCAAASFTILNTWMSQMVLTELWRPGVPQLKLRIYQFDRLLARKLPVLHHHFKSMELPPDFFASQWFMTLLSYNLPFPILLRAWDLLLLEGWKTIFRFGLSILAHLESDLLKLSIEEISQFLRDSREKIGVYNVDEFVAFTLKIKITNQMLLDLEGDYIAHILNIQLQHGKLASPNRRSTMAQSSMNPETIPGDADLPRNGLALLQELLRGGHAVGHPEQLSEEELSALNVREERIEDIDPRKAALIQAEIDQMELPTRGDIKVLREKIEHSSKALERERTRFTHVAWGFVLHRTKLEEVLEYKAALVAQLQRVIETEMSKPDFRHLQEKIDQVQRELGKSVLSYSRALRETASAQLDLQDESERKMLLVDQLHHLLQVCQSRTRSHLLSTRSRPASLSG